MEINGDLLEKALEAYKVWLEQPTGPGLTDLNEQVKQAGFVRPGGGLDFDSFMQIAVERGSAIAPPTTALSARSAPPSKLVFKQLKQAGQLGGWMK